LHRCLLHQQAALHASEQFQAAGHSLPWPHAPMGTW
jgi:hypothetical protein